MTRTTPDGQPLKFGYFLIPDAGDPAGVLETARLVDSLGFDVVGVVRERVAERRVSVGEVQA